MIKGNPFTEVPFYRQNVFGLLLLSAAQVYDCGLFKCSYFVQLCLVVTCSFHIHVHVSFFFHYRCIILYFKDDFSLFMCL